MEAVQVISEKERAQTLLQGDRSQLLARLREPGSATTLAKDLGIPRQKVNYHLRELEKAGLVELVEERRARNCLERVVQATARVYVISPEILDELGESRDEQRDTFSADYLIAGAARTIQELGALQAAAKGVKKRLATLSLESDVRFASAADRNAFSEELTTLVAQLIAKYHDASASRGRDYRFKTGIYPVPKKTPSRRKETDHE
jgi:DNA-binding transcriptional ArsR family regulator